MKAQKTVNGCAETKPPTSKTDKSQVQTSKAAKPNTLNFIIKLPLAETAGTKEIGENSILAISRKIVAELSVKMPC